MVNTKNINKYNKKDKNSLKKNNKNNIQEDNENLGVFFENLDIDFDNDNGDIIEEKIIKKLIKKNKGKKEEKIKKTRRKEIKKKNGKGISKAKGEKAYETEEGKKKLKMVYESLKYDMSIVQACAWADLSISTFNNWMKENKEIRDNVEKYKEFAFIFAKKALGLAMQSGDYKAAIEFLKRRDKNYKDKQEVENTGVQPITKIEVVPVDVSKIN